MHNLVCRKDTNTIFFWSEFEHRIANWNIDCIGRIAEPCSCALTGVTCVKLETVEVKVSLFSSNGILLELYGQVY